MTRRSLIWLIIGIISPVAMTLLIMEAATDWRIERSENMKCEIEGHESVKVIILPEDYPHYAKLVCAHPGCVRPWLKWLGRSEADHLLAMVAEEKARVYGVDLSVEMTNEIRRIAREEVGKAFRDATRQMVK